VRIVVVCDKRYVIWDMWYVGISQASSVKKIWSSETCFAHVGTNLFVQL